MALTDALKTVCIETARSLKGAARRRFPAQTVRALGQGGQCLAERERGWKRQTLRKAELERQHRQRRVGDISNRRRKRAEAQLPKRRAAIKALVDGQRQTAPQVRSKRL